MATVGREEKSTTGGEGLKLEAELTVDVRLKSDERFERMLFDSIASDGLGGFGGLGDVEEGEGRLGPGLAETVRSLRQATERPSFAFDSVCPTTIFHLCHLCPSWSFLAFPLLRSKKGNMQPKRMLGFCSCIQ